MQISSVDGMVSLRQAESICVGNKPHAQIQHYFMTSFITEVSSQC